MRLETWEKFRVECRGIERSTGRVKRAQIEGMLPSAVSLADLIEAKLASCSCFRWYTL